MQELSIGQCATLACLLEVTAPKPGNVHRGADYDYVTLNDFAASAVALGPAMEQASVRPVGRTILDAIDARRRVTSVNTNLGIVLLLAPLAAVPRATPLAEGIAEVLERLNQQDAADVYRAIRETAPGGLDPRDQRVSQHDVANDPPDSLLVAMRDAAEWDLIARQYTHQFADVLQTALPWLEEANESHSLPESIVYVHIRMMSEYPDSLISRKCGRDVAAESAARAASVLEAGPAGTEDYWQAVAELDFWLRSEDSQRNPGTTADMIAGGLFAGLRDGRIQPPFG